MHDNECVIRNYYYNYTKFHLLLQFSHPLILPVFSYSTRNLSLLSVCPPKDSIGGGRGSHGVRLVGRKRERERERERERREKGGRGGFALQWHYHWLVWSCVERRVWLRRHALPLPVLPSSLLPRSLPSPASMLLLLDVVSRRRNRRHCVVHSRSRVSLASP